MKRKKRLPLSQKGRQIFQEKANQDFESYKEEKGEAFERESSGLEVESDFSRDEGLASFDWTRVDEQQKIFSIKQTIKGTVYGPYNIKMFETFLAENRMNDQTFVFTPGMSDWKQLAEIDYFVSRFNLTPLLENNDKRHSIRRPFIARMFFHDNKQLFVGVCRDISIGGMQVLVSDFPLTIGDEIALNVHPENNDHHFVANGQVGRILDGNQGFFVRFNGLGQKATESIMNYLNKEAA